MEGHVVEECSYSLNIGRTSEMIWGESPRGKVTLPTSEVASAPTDLKCSLQIPPSHIVAFSKKRSFLNWAHPLNVPCHKYGLAIGWVWHCLRLSPNCTDHSGREAAPPHKEPAMFWVFQQPLPDSCCCLLNSLLMEQTSARLLSCGLFCFGFLFILKFGLYRLWNRSNSRLWEPRSVCLTPILLCIFLMPTHACSLCSNLRCWVREERDHSLPCKHEDLSLTLEPTYKCQVCLLSKS